ncbi:hypothetical protein CISIN_1g033905mg [Citrus sinensis]|uniref:Uncharacterized protein n=1 Tax=Citrus sinensis TaxID=2711 RepID=A0A067CZW5_CITSI|nr:hypothetical protein CISIN_1g033905mg [Citrus sinensis]
MGLEAFVAVLVLRGFEFGILGDTTHQLPTVPRQPTATPSVLTRSHHHRRSSQAQHAAPRVASPAPSRQPASHGSREHQYALNLAPAAAAHGCQQQRTHSALNTPCPRDL